MKYPNFEMLDDLDKLVELDDDHWEALDADLDDVLRGTVCTVSRRPNRYMP